jgi:hypothetical protein
MAEATDMSIFLPDAEGVYRIGTGQLLGISKLISKQRLTEKKKKNIKPKIESPKFFEW